MERELPLQRLQTVFNYCLFAILQKNIAVRVQNPCFRAM